MTNIFSHGIYSSEDSPIKSRVVYSSDQDVPIKSCGGCPKPTLRVVRLEKDAVLPSKSNPSDAGYDLYAVEETTIPARGRALVRTGIAMAIPSGHVGLIWPRSGTAVKAGLDVLAGVVDSGYRGEVCVVLQNHSDADYIVRMGDRAAQMLIQKVSSVEMKTELSLDESDRGTGGFGSSGK